MNFVIVAIFAFFGGNLRYLLGGILPKIAGFPLGTLVANLVGCFLFSWLVKQIMSQKQVNARLVLGVGTGFFGAFTTFSSFALDTVTLLQKGQVAAAVLYLVLSIVGGFFFAMLGELVISQKEGHK